MGYFVLCNAPVELCGFMFLWSCVGYFLLYVPVELCGLFCASYMYNAPVELCGLFCEFELYVE